MTYQPIYYATALNFAGVEYFPFQRMLPPKVEVVSDADLQARASRDELLQRMGMPIPTGYVAETYRIPYDGDPAAVLIPALTGATPQPKTPESASTEIAPQIMAEAFAGDPYQTFPSPFMRDEDLRRMAAEAFRILPVAMRDEWDLLPESQQDVTFTSSGTLTRGAVDDIRWVFADALQDGLTADEMLPRYREYAKTHPAGQGIPEAFLQVSYNLWASRMLERAAESVAEDRGWLGWRYVTQDDPRVRPTHAAMHGVMRPLNDPLWKTWTPPAGMGCRCYREPATADDLKKQQWTDPVPKLTP
jgi:SPP1 gp7 family putative phage head morphogenesis protein